MPSAGRRGPLRGRRSHVCARITPTHTHTRTHRRQGPGAGRRGRSRRPGTVLAMPGRPPAPGPPVPRRADGANAGSHSPARRAWSPLVTSERSRDLTCLAAAGRRDRRGRHYRGHGEDGAVAMPRRGQRRVSTSMGPVPSLPAWAPPPPSLRGPRPLPPSVPSLDPRARPWAAHSRPGMPGTPFPHPSPLKGRTRLLCPPHPHSGVGVGGAQCGLKIQSVLLLEVSIQKGAGSKPRIFG